MESPPLNQIHVNANSHIGVGIALAKEYKCKMLDYKSQAQE